MPMGESADKGLEVKGANRESREIGRIMAKGYDRGLRRRDVESALRKLYSSCGEITDVYIARFRKTLWPSAYVYFVGEGAVDKALKLNGSDMGGWTVDAVEDPFPEEFNNCSELEVRGYDTSLSKYDLKCELGKFFSSCGRIVDLYIFTGFSLVTLVGEDAAEKAPKLSGSDIRGHKVQVRLVRYLGKTTVHRRDLVITGRRDIVVTGRRGLVITDRRQTDTRKAYGFGTRQGPSMLPTMDKSQAAKIQEQEKMLRAAVNDGAGTRLPPDQRQITGVLPAHLADVLIINDAGKNGVPGQSNNINSQGMLQVSGTQFMGRSAGATFDNTTSPLPYANSSRSRGMVNALSPQQQQLQQQQRAKLMQLPQHQQQLLAQQQQLRQSSVQNLGQPMAARQQFQARQLSSGHIQQSMSQGQLNPTMNRHLNQFSGGANSVLFTSAQGSPSSQMIPNMSSMQSQTPVPRMQQYGVSSTNPQRSHASQMLGDQLFNSSGMIQMQQTQSQQPQQQHQQQGGSYGNMQTNQQSLQPNNMLQNAQQRHQNPQ